MPGLRHRYSKKTQEKLKKTIASKGAHAAYIKARKMGTIGGASSTINRKKRKK